MSFAARPSFCLPLLACAMPEVISCGPSGQSLKLNYCKLPGLSEMINIRNYSISWPIIRQLNTQAAATKLEETCTGSTYFPRSKADNTGTSQQYSKHALAAQQHVVFFLVLFCFHSPRTSFNLSWLGLPDLTLSIKKPGGLKTGSGQEPWILSSFPSSHRWTRSICLPNRAS